MRVINQAIKYDSIAKQNIIRVDTQFGKPLYFQMIDSLGKPILDSLTHKPKINPQPQYALISKDSVNWRIQGVSVDSLLKK